MDDLIVIILTLIFIVAGFFGQVKKHRAAAEGKANVPPGRSDPFEFQDEEWEEPSISRSEGAHRDTVLSPENEGGSISVKNLSSEIRSQRRVKTGKKKKFPLREAVIYSEILRQKYF
jgi:hypothetical protein